MNQMQKKAVKILQLIFKCLNSPFTQSETRITSDLFIKVLIYKRVLIIQPNQWTKTENIKQK